MELRKHPCMTFLGRSNWPPAWTGPFGPSNPLPRGEVGVLIRVLDSAPSILNSPHCFVVIQWNQQEYVGSLHFDAEDAMREIVILFRNHLGRPIAEIGSLNVP